MIKEKSKTAKDIALDLLKSYVRRGDTFENIKRGGLTVHSSYYHASIGGFVGKKNLPHDKIIVYRIKNKKLKIPEVFSTLEIFNQLLRK